MSASYINAGDIITLDIKGQTVEAIVIKRNPANFKIRTEHGEGFNMPHNYPHTFVRTGTYDELQKAINPTGVALKLGAPVIIKGKPSSKFYGMRGLVAKVNPSKVQVVIENVGVINCPPAILQNAEV